MITGAADSLFRHRLVGLGEWMGGAEGLAALTHAEHPRVRRCAVLCCAVLYCAVVCCDVLCCAVLCHACMWGTGRNSLHTSARDARRVAVLDHAVGSAPVHADLPTPQPCRTSAWHPRPVGQQLPISEELAGKPPLAEGLLTYAQSARPADHNTLCCSDRPLQRGPPSEP